MTSVPAQGILEANDGQVLRAAALKHHGILMQPMYIIHDDVIAGRLVPLLQEWELARLTINIAYPTRRHLPAKVRCFVDFLVEKFAEQDFERTLDRLTQACSARRIFAASTIACSGKHFFSAAGISSRSRCAG